MASDATPPLPPELSGWLTDDPMFKDFRMMDAGPARITVDASGLILILCANDVPDSLLGLENLLAIPVTEDSARAVELARRHPVVLGPPIAPLPLRLALQQAIGHLEMRQEVANAQMMADQFRAEIDELQKIGLALSSEHNIDSLLSMILEKARNLVGADAGSLYVVEPVPGAAEAEGQPAARQLRFSVSQNESISIPFTQFVMPITTKSIAGYVAATGQSLNISDVYRIPATSEFGFNRSFDEKFGYRSKSMLTVPMRNRDDEVIGVLQLINRKRSMDVRLTDHAITEQDVVSFDFISQNMIEAVASQAAVALTNATLYEEIQRLFEGFVHASVMAIESRDPTTSGHSHRVALFTTGLAEVVDQASDGPFRLVRFNREELKEIEYASLLHDFGKVGVREKVLVKANKLYEPTLELIVQRFHYIRKSIESDFTRRKLEMLMTGRGKKKAMEGFPALDSELESRLLELDQFMKLVLDANRPTVLPDGNFEQLQRLSNTTYLDINDQPQPYLTPIEVRNLSIRKGSLNEEERQEIESHVVHTFKFLEKIPWSKAYKRIPEIAGKHHEKLDGKGYPGHIGERSIPIQTRMMTISDIFDALTASDRPYKRAVPHEKALGILEEEVKSGQLDGQLLEIFIGARVYERALSRPN